VVGVGVGSGVLSALAGVGGAVVSTPGIRALGATPIESVGSTVPAIIPSAITGTFRYAKAGLVVWRVGLTCGLAGAITSLAGAYASDRVDGTVLMVLTALLVLWSSVSVLRRPDPVADEDVLPVEVDEDVAPEHLEHADHDAPRVGRTGLLIALGLGAGFVAGFLGVGGGIVLVPAFGAFLDLDVKETVATSLVAVAIMSVASLTGHLIEGHVEWAYALPLMIGVIPGARIGSRIAVSVSDRTMRLLCGSLLGVLGLVYLVSELIAA
jgi:uncharacterized membrane protein YfcA